MHTLSTQAANKPTNRHDWHNLSAILSFLMSFKGYVFIALFGLVLAKLTIVGVPYVLKLFVDHLQVKPDHVLLLPIGLLITYGGVRLLQFLFAELRDAVCAKVCYRTKRRISTRVLDQTIYRYVFTENAKQVLLSVILNVVQPPVNDIK
ncbi:ABC transporter ATP-binding protein [Thiolinea disciformis]|uniref:ABC transporter ATP-binding protein n=1 Tax=Thiolinea disciformis TaxID=125614 RepID=UPI000374D852|nr:ABC transporter ATP-binding protein [Thiolinea disciformis]